jgi:tRNA dimethylallyltransferase
VRLARRIGGEIVNADSMQLYGDLRILTARPGPDEEVTAPHHLFGVADAADAWSVGRWLNAATATMADIAGRGRPAIVVGGTGLYFRALTAGLAEVPAIAAQVRAASQALYDDVGEAAFREILARVDPDSEARIAGADRQRLTRAHEVFAASGRSLTAWQSETKPTLAARTWHGIVLEPSRAALYARCDARLATMIDSGALDEVARLIARRLDPRLPAMRALGVTPLAAHLRGELTLDKALARARQDTRRYAKRQLTWFRNQAPDWPRLADPQATPGAD